MLELVPELGVEHEVHADPLQSNLADRQKMLELVGPFKHGRYASPSLLRGILAANVAK